MASGEDVQLPDLQVIQRYSLAVRGASAPLADVVAALQADLAWLTGSGRRSRVAPSVAAPDTSDIQKPVAVKQASAKKAPARAATVTKAPAKKAPAKKAPARKATATRAPAKKAPARKGTRRA